MGQLPRCRNLIRKFILVVLGDSKRENRSIFLRFSQLGQLCGDHRKELLFGQNRDAQLPGLGELAAGLLPADNVAGLAGHGAASGGPEADDLAVDAVTGEVLQLARSNDGAAVEGAVGYVDTIRIHLFFRHFLHHPLRFSQLWYFLPCRTYCGSCRPE